MKASLQWMKDYVSVNLGENPQEFADAILMFLSPFARAVTGQNLIVDGGLVKG